MTSISTPYPVPYVLGNPHPDLTRFLAEWADAGRDYVELRTSGSTGEPKPIRLAKDDMMLSARSTCSFFGLDSGSMLALALPATHIAGQMVAVRAGVCGGRLYAESPSNTPLANLPAGMTVDLVSVVPSQVDGLLRAGNIGRVRALLVGGAPLDASVEAELASVATLGAYATYGMTETCSNVALRRLGQPVYVANDGFRFSTDHRGCLVVESGHMSFGRVVTNDVVRLYDSTHFEWVGRADNVINSGGLKIHPEELEDRLAPLLGAGTFYVTSRPSRKWGREVVIVHEGVVDDLTRQKAALLLEPHERPKDWIAVGELPRTSNGKLRRRKF